MAVVNARVADLERGTLPPVCAKTGVPTEGWAKIRFSSAPTWTWILLLFVIFPFLIAQYFATVHIEGIVPMSDVAQRRVTVFNRLFIGLVALGVVVIAVGFVLDIEAAVILVGRAILVAAVFTMFLAKFWLLTHDLNAAHGGCSWGARRPVAYRGVDTAWALARAPPEPRCRKTVSP